MALLTVITLALALPTAARETPRKHLPRGDYGFILGASVAEVDAVARRAGYSGPGRNDSTGPDGWRDFTFPSTAPVININMFIEQVGVAEISVYYRADDAEKSFKRLLGELRKRFGKEIGVEDAYLETPIQGAEKVYPPIPLIDRWHVQKAFWADKKTVIELSSDRGLSITYHDLPKGGQLNFGRFGSGKSFSFTGE